MPTIELTLPTPHDGQRRMYREERRFNVAACGRRFGKSEAGKNRLIRPALAGLPVAWFSPTYKMLLEVWRDLRHMLQPVAARVNGQERRIELITGGVVEMWSLDNPDSARGRKYALAVIDEAAMVSELGAAWQAVIRPTLTDYEGGAWFLSTPKGHNFFWQMFNWGNDDTRTDWAAWQLPTVANPHIKPSEVEAARLELPERIYAQEYLATFLDDGGGVFRRVREAATAQQHDRAIVGHDYCIGIDWGKLNDFTVLTVLDMATGEIVYVDRFNQIDYSVQIGRLYALCERFNPVQLIAERNSIGEPLIEQLQRRGLPVVPFQTTNATKAAAIDALALAFERGDIRILDDSTLIAELLAFEMDRTPSGMVRYSAPEGMHDDMVMSLALAWQALARPAGVFL